MRMLKSIAAAAMSVCLLTALTGCQERLPAEQSPSSAPVSVAPTEPPVPTPAELMKAMEAYDAEMVTAMEYDMAVDYALELPGIVNSGAVKMKLAFIGNPLKNLDQLEMMGDVTVTAAGQDMLVSLYMKGKDIYAQYMGQKMKFTREDMLGDVPVSQPEGLDELLGKLDVDSLKPTDAKVERTDDGYTLSCSVSGQKILDMLKNLIKEIAPDEESKALIDEQLPENIALDDITLVIKTDADSKPKSFDIHMGVKMMQEMPDINNPEETIETEIKLSLDVQLNFNKSGDAVTITPPADLDTYQEMDDTPALMF